jgi:tape measure domain-containing protein
MATYRIDFSTNASRVAQEIDKVNKALTEAVRTSKPIEIRLDDTKLMQQLNTTFKQLDKKIAKYERQLRKLPVGSTEFIDKASGIGKLEGQRQMGQMTAQAIRLQKQAGAFPQESFAGLSREIQAAKISASMIQPNTEAWTNLQREIARLNFDLQKADKLAENIRLTENLGAFEPRSLNALEAKLTILRNRAREISPNEGEWKKVNAEIVKTEQAIEKQTRRPLTTGQRMGAAGGAFLYGGGLGGGVGSAVGGIAGGLAGGVPGAFTGAAIGQATDSLQQMTAAMVEQSVVIDKLRLGLSSVSTDFEDFINANKEITDTANRLLLPLDQVYKKFIQLRSSTRALGIDTQTTGQLFEGTAAAVLRAGGSMDDVDGAMRAVVQVFSKGKLTAEELRGQLAERLPGAVVDFAQSSGMSLQELDKAFEGGTTSLDDFVKFLRGKAKESKSYTDEMAVSSEYAGARMQKAFEGVRLNIGRAFQPAGAAIQDFATRSIKFLDGVINKAIELKLIQPGSGFYAEQVLQGGMTKEQLQEQINQEQARVNASKEQGLRALAGGANTIAGKILADLGGAYSDTKLKELQAALKELEKYDKNFKAAAKQVKEGMAAEQRPEKFLNIIERREEALVNARQNYEQEIASIRENAIKQAEGLERRYRDQRLQDEREIGRVRRELAAAVSEEELLRRGIAGEDPALLEQERKIGDAIRQYTEDKISREEEAQDRQIAQSREIEDFKRQNADAINKANERYANAIGKIQQEYAKSVAKLIEDGSGNGAKKLAAAGKLIAAQIARASAQEAFVAAAGGAIIPRGAGSYEVGGRQMSEADLLAAAEKSSPNVKTAAKAFVDATRQIDQAQKELNATIKVTAQTNAVSLKAVSTADIEASIKARGDALNASIAAINKEKDALSKQQNIRNVLFSSIKDASAEVNAAKLTIEEQTESILEQIQLIRGGTLPALAEESAARDAIFAKQRNLTQEAADQLLSAIKDKDIQEDVLAILESQLQVINEQQESFAGSQQTLRDRAALLEAQKIESQMGIVGQGLRSGFINEAGAAFEQQIGQGVSPEVAASVARATEQLTIAKGAADALQSSINGIGAAFGEAMTTGVASLVSGTASAKEVFASFLQSVGQALSQAASQMIATYIAIGIAKLFAGLGGASSDMSKAGISEGTLAPMRQYPMITNANGNVLKGGFQAFANGGVVTGPTLGLVGEGKYNEAVVPLPDGRSIPVSFGGRSARDLMGNGAPGMPQAPSLSMKFETTKINGVEYVSREQLEQAMAETRRASIAGGAKQGMSMTLDKIKQSPSTRSRIGMR